MDITEIHGADCLHAPEGVIDEAQKLAASLYGSEKTYFLVNGSTSGLHAMLHAVVKPGAKVLVGRDCHISALNALTLLDAEPVFVMPDWDEDHRLPLGISLKTIEAALKQHPSIQAALFTRPSYYGIAFDLDEISDFLEQRQVPLIIDEAHGAHFKFHPLFPKPALDFHIEACVQSLHKTLPALTQTAYLHVGQHSATELQRYDQAVSMLLTTSPSYVLMASMDIAREIMEKQGKALYDKLFEILNVFDDGMEKIRGIRRVKIDRKGVSNDFSRLVLSFEGLGLTGFEAEKILREQYNITPEMADLWHIVLIATPFHSKDDFNRLLKALEHMACQYGAGQSASHNMPRLPMPYRIPERILSLKEAWLAHKVVVPLMEAAGRVCGKSVVPYPPGIPVLNPGERITPELVLYVQEILSMGCPVHGIIDQGIQVCI